MKKRLGSIARFVFGIALAAYIIYANRDAFSRLEFSAIHWHFFAAGIVGCIVMTVMTMVRWYGLVRATGLPFTRRDSLPCAALMNCLTHSGTHRSRSSRRTYQFRCSVAAISHPRPNNIWHWIATTRQHVQVPFEIRLAVSHPARRLSFSVFVIRFMLTKILS